MIEATAQNHGNERFTSHHYAFWMYYMYTCSHENVYTPVLGRRNGIFLVHRFNSLFCSYLLNTAPADLFALYTQKMGKR